MVSFTNELKKSLEDIVYHNHTIVLDETEFSLGSSLSNQVRSSRNLSECDQDVLIEERKYIEFLHHLLRKKKRKIFVPREVVNGIYRHREFWNYQIEYFSNPKLKRKQRHCQDRMNLIRKIRDNLTRLIPMCDQYVPDVDEGCYSSLQKAIIRLGEEYNLKRVSPAAHKKKHDASTTDESIVALAFYLSILNGRNPVEIISNDSDILRLTENTAKMLFCSDFCVPECEDSEIRVYNYFTEDFHKNPDNHVYSLKLNTRSLSHSGMLFDSSAKEEISAYLSRIKV